MTEGLGFRRALPVEQRALEDLQRRASLMWEEDRAALRGNPEAIELPMDQITNGRTIVAERMGKTVGFAVLLRREDGDAELDGLLVDPEIWRQDIGRGLIDESLKCARAEGALSIWVIANSRALDFYQACGFEMLAAVPTRFRPGIRMRKVLV